MIYKISKSSYRITHQFFWIICIYCCLAAILLALGLSHDNYLLLRQTLSPSNSGASYSLAVLPMFLVFYGLRVGLLYFFWLIKQSSFVAVWRGGIIGSLFAEAPLMLVAYSGISEKIEYCSSSGDFSNCGWLGMAFAFVAIASFVIQAFGMGAGYSIARIIHKPKKSLVVV